MQFIPIDFTPPPARASAFMYMACEALRLADKKIGQAIAAFDDEPARTHREQYRQRINNSLCWDIDYEHGLDIGDLEDARMVLQFNALILQEIGVYGPVIPDSALKAIDAFENREPEHVPGAESALLALNLARGCLIEAEDLLSDGPDDARTVAAAVSHAIEAQAAKFEGLMIPTYNIDKVLKRIRRGEAVPSKGDSRSKTSRKNVQ